MATGSRSRFAEPVRRTDLPVDYMFSGIATKDLKYSVNNSLQNLYINELSIKMQPISFRLTGPAQNDECISGELSYMVNVVIAKSTHPSTQ